MVNREHPLVKRLDRFLEFLIENGGSDLHIKAGAETRGRVNGSLTKFTKTVFSEEDSFELTRALVGDSGIDELQVRKSLDFSYALNKDYRFRVNLFKQINGISFVFRAIPTNIPTIDDLKLPEVIKKITDESMRGLVLITGPTGSGKTTTIASMINRINHSRLSHIVSIEDPVEFVYNDSKCIINQRSIGEDCNTFSDSLRAALREDPDIIFVGEMRDLETIDTALHAAETGHLVLSTLHTVDAKETINRIVSMFGSKEQERVRLSLASVLEAVISQRLVLTTDGKRRAAVEVLRKTVRIKDMILENRIHEITDAMKESGDSYGMQTFDEHLLELYRDGIISKEEALDKSTIRSDLDLAIKNVIAERGGNQINEDNMPKLKEL